jgi:hypothetical protein
MAYGEYVKFPYIETRADGLPRILNSGTTMATVTYICTQEAFRGEDPPSAFLSEFCDRKSATRC